VTPYVAWLVACATALGFPHPPKGILRAIEVACNSDVQCSEDAILYAVHESGLQAEPKLAWSWDAKAGVSCGVWQTPCATLPKTLVGQARVWVELRRLSLAQFGDLRGLAGANDAGVRLTRHREQEHEDMVFGATWGVLELKP
jgi:hypothetical protein